MSAPVRLSVKTMLVIAVTLVVIQASGFAHPAELAALGRRGDGGDLAVRDFGPEHVPDALPFDGQDLYVTARLLPDWDAINDQLDESSYRLVRILHPLLASPAGAGVPVLLLMQLWNVVGIGLLTWALADVLLRHGHEPRWALTAAPACVIPLFLTTSEPLAFGLAMAGVALADRHRLVGASALLALGGLTRESALTCAVAAAAMLWTSGLRRGAAGVLIGSIAPVAAWWAYVQSVTPYSRTPLELFGFLKIGEQASFDIVTSVVAIALIVVAVVAWWDVPPFRWVNLGFAAWLPIYEGFGFRVVGIPRLSLISMALGVAGLARWTAGTSPDKRVLVESTR